MDRGLRKAGARASRIFGFLYHLRHSEAVALAGIGIPNAPREIKHGLNRLGAVERDGWRVEVSLTALPARFWGFTITTSEGRRYELETGSGRLEEYWPTVLLFAAGMLDAARLKDAAPAAELPVVSLGQGTSRVDIMAADLLPGGAS